MCVCVGGQYNWMESEVWSSYAGVSGSHVEERLKLALLHVSTGCPLPGHHAADGKHARTPC